MVVVAVLAVPPSLTDTTLNSTTTTNSSSDSACRRGRSSGPSTAKHIRVWYIVRGRSGRGYLHDALSYARLAGAVY